MVSLSNDHILHIELSALGGCGEVYFIDCIPLGFVLVFSCWLQAPGQFGAHLGGRGQPRHGGGHHPE